MTQSTFAFVLRRLLAAVALVAFVTTGAFLLTHLAPGDYMTEAQMTGMRPDAIAAARIRLGLDRPLVDQITHWAAGLERLDLGESALYGRPVRGLVVTRMLATAELAGLALVVATLIGLPLGVLTGARPQSLLARVVGVVSIALVACPPIVVVLGLMLLAVMSGWSIVLQGHAVVPVIALSAPVAAMLERLQSQAMRDALVAPDLLAGAARGVRPERLLWLHAARHALRPILGVYGIVIGALFSGSFIVEIVTAWPGLGRLTVDALVSRDLYLVAGCALAGSACLAAGNLIADLARAAADPRVRDRR